MLQHATANRRLDYAIERAVQTEVVHRADTVAGAALAIGILRPGSRRAGEVLSNSQGAEVVVVMRPLDGVDGRRWRQSGITSAFIC